METCASAAFGDPLGNLLLRGIDNQDGDCLRRAKWVLSRSLTNRAHMGILVANKTAQDVLSYLIDQRCHTCCGRQFVRLDTSVRACPTCSGSGLVGALPVYWRKYHQLVLHEAQASIGRALAQARAASGG